MSREHHAYPAQYALAPQAHGPHGGQMSHGHYAVDHYPTGSGYGVHYAPSYAYTATQPNPYLGPRGGYSTTSSTDRFLKGLLIGAGVAYLVTN